VCRVLAGILNRLEASLLDLGSRGETLARIGPLLESSASLFVRPPGASEVHVFDNQLDVRLSMVNCDFCDRHVHDLLLKHIRYRIKGSGSAPFVHAYVFCMRYKSSRDTWKIASSDALLELLSHSSFLCAFFSKTVRTWRLCASLKSRRRHPSYCVRCTLRRDK